MEFKNLSYRQKKRVEKVAKALFDSGAWGNFDYEDFQYIDEQTRELFFRRALAAIRHT